MKFTVPRLRYAGRVISSSYINICVLMHRLCYSDWNRVALTRVLAFLGNQAGYEYELSNTGCVMSKEIRIVDGVKCILRGLINGRSLYYTEVVDVFYRKYGVVVSTKQVIDAVSSIHTRGETVLKEQDRVTKKVRVHMRDE